jgi:hypothetical protein
LELQVQRADKREQEALDYVWREAVKLLEDPAMTRKRLRQRLWVVMLKARAGHASHYKS